MICFRHILLSSIQEFVKLWNLTQLHVFLVPKQSACRKTTHQELLNFMKKKKNGRVRSLLLEFFFSVCSFGQAYNEKEERERGLMKQCFVFFRCILLSSVQGLVKLWTLAWSSCSVAGDAAVSQSYGWESLANAMSQKPPQLHGLRFIKDKAKRAFPSISNIAFLIQSASRMYDNGGAAIKHTRRVKLEATVGVTKQGQRNGTLKATSNITAQSGNRVARVTVQV